jgi:MFS-type transporter involved in bile tolerance (Atg22 family)
LKQPPNKLPNNIIRYSNIALQMIVIIVLGTFGGKYLDKYLQLKFPVFTLIGVLLSIFIALYTTIKEFLKK